jgi:hypothetical protein
MPAIIPDAGVAPCRGNNPAHRRVCRLSRASARRWFRETTMTARNWRLLAALLLLGVLTGCAAERQPSAMDWLESEYLKDPGRR